MTKKQNEIMDSAIAAIKDIKENKDIEVVHALADDVLCDVLKKIGMTELVDMFYNLPRWYG